MYESHPSLVFPNLNGAHHCRISSLLHPDPLSAAELTCFVCLLISLMRMRIRAAKWFHTDYWNRIQ